MRQGRASVRKRLCEQLGEWQKGSVIREALVDDETGPVLQEEASDGTQQTPDA